VSDVVDLRVPASCLDEDDEAELTWRVIARVYDAVSPYDGAETTAGDLERLTPGQRALFALHWCVSETLNGGFDQFFTNSNGILTEEALMGFRRIGVPEAASILQAAHEVLASRPPEADVNAPEFDEADEADRFDAYLAQYEPLQRRFDELVDGELYARAASYVRQHPEEFVR
jgi:hypothetical protein